MSKIVSISLSPDRATALGKLAQQENVSRSKFVSRLIDGALKRQRRREAQIKARAAQTESEVARLTPVVEQIVNNLRGV